MATSLALYLEIDPSGFLLIRKTHLDPITFCEWSLGTRSLVPCASNALNSLLIASRHSSDFIALETHVGSMVDGMGMLGG